MTDALRTRKEVARHARKVQRTFLPSDSEVEPSDTQDSALSPPQPGLAHRVPGPPPCRMALARWPDEWRERWGRRANALEESGLPWHEAEARAFVEVWNERRAAGQTDREGPASEAIGSESTVA